MELTQEMFEKMAGVLAKGGPVAVLEGLVDAHLCAEMHKGALASLAEFERRTGNKLDAAQREQFIVTFVFEQTKRGIFNALDDDDDDDDDEHECNHCGQCGNTSADADNGNKMSEVSARDMLAKLLAGLSK